MKPHGRRLRLGVVVGVGALLFAGCKTEPPRLVPAGGKVVLHGKSPGAGVTINLYPLNPDYKDLIPNGATDAAGKFQLRTFIPSLKEPRPGAMPGRYKVTLVPYTRHSFLPEAYRQDKTTPLEVTIPEGGKEDLLIRIN